MCDAALISDRARHWIAILEVWAPVYCHMTEARLKHSYINVFVTHLVFYAFVWCNKTVYSYHIP